MVWIAAALIVVALFAVYEERGIRSRRLQHLAASEQSRRELRDSRIRELEIECGIVEAPQEPVKAPLSPVEQFWASVDTGEHYVPLAARGVIRTGGTRISAVSITADKIYAPGPMPLDVGETDQTT